MQLINCFNFYFVLFVLLFSFISVLSSDQTNSGDAHGDHLEKDVEYQDYTTDSRESSENTKHEQLGLVPIRSPTVKVATEFRSKIFRDYFGPKKYETDRKKDLKENSNLKVLDGHLSLPPQRSKSVSEKEANIFVYLPTSVRNSRNKSDSPLESASSMQNLNWFKARSNNLSPSRRLRQQPRITKRGYVSDNALRSVSYQSSVPAFTPSLSVQIPQQQPYYIQAPVNQYVATAPQPVSFQLSPAPQVSSVALVPSPTPTYFTHVQPQPLLQVQAAPIVAQVPQQIHVATPQQFSAQILTASPPTQAIFAAAPNKQNYQAAPQQSSYGSTIKSASVTYQKAQPQRVAEYYVPSLPQKTKTVYTQTQYMPSKTTIYTTTHYTPATKTTVYETDHLSATSSGKSMSNGYYPPPTFSTTSSMSQSSAPIDMYGSASNEVYKSEMPYYYYDDWTRVKKKFIKSLPKISVILPGSLFTMPHIQLRNDAKSDHNARRPSEEPKNYLLQRYLYAKRGQNFPNYN